MQRDSWPSELAQGTTVSIATEQLGEGSAPLSPVSDDVASAAQTHLLATWRAELISLRAMGWPLRVLTILTPLLVVGGVVVLFLGTGATSPGLAGVTQVSVESTQNGLEIDSPAIVIALLPLLLLPALTFTLSGALRVHPALRLPVVVVVGLILGAVPLGALQAFSMNEQGIVEALGPDLAGTVWVVRLGQLALVVLLLLWALGSSLAWWMARRKTGDVASARRAGPERTFVLVLALLLVYYGLDLFLWSAFQMAGRGAQGTEFVLTNLSAQAWILPFFIVAILYWASMNIADFGHAVGIVGVRLVTRLRAPWLLYGVTAAAALAMAADVLRVESQFVLPSLALVVALSVVVALVMRFARIDVSWPAHPPAVSLLVGALALYAVGGFDIVYNLVQLIDPGANLGAGRQEVFSFLARASIEIVAAFVALALIVSGRARGRPTRSVTGLFLFLVMLAALFSDLPNLLTVLRVASPRPPYLTLNSVRLCVALGVLVLVVWLAARGGAAAGAKGSAILLERALLLLVGLEVIYLALNFSALLNGLDRLPTATLVALSIGGVLWDLLTSGGEATNGDSPGLPHAGRVLLYLGYTLIAAVLLFYIGSLHVGGLPTAPVPEGFSVDRASDTGLFILGVPLVTLSFLIGVGRWHASAVSAAEPAHIGNRPAVVLPAIGIGLGCTLSLILVVVLALETALPTLSANTLSLNATLAYIAPTPGMGCDTGGALWMIPGNFVDTTTVSCSAAGLRVEAAPGKRALVEFITPEGIGRLPERYAVSVQVALKQASPSNQASRCGGLVLRSTEDGGNSDMLCDNGSFAILHYDYATNSTTFATQILAARPADAYSLVAAVDGTQQRMSVIGAGAVSSWDTPHRPNEHIDLLVDNPSSTPQSVTFSGFVYSPLREKLQPAYTPSVPAPAPGYRTYTATSGVWGVNYPEQATITTSDLDLAALSAKNVQFTLDQETALAVYDVPLILDNSQIQALLGPIAAAFGANDVTPPQQQPGLLSFGNTVWQFVQVQASVGGVQYGVDIFYTTHGTHTYLVGAAAPAVLLADAEKLVFAPMLQTFTFLH